MGVIEDIIKKIQERQAEVDQLIAGLQTALNNANTAIDNANKTMVVVQTAISEVKTTVVELRTDYEALKQKIDNIINPPPKPSKTGIFHGSG